MEENKKVLILGNGLSRILYNDFIDRWDGELWGCNFVFYDWGHKLNRLTGHVEVLRDAAEHRKAKKHKYEIWGGNLGAFESDHLFTCDKQFQKDSGTTLIAQALHEYYRVYCVGFDLGGKDIYSPLHHEVDKGSWVLRWRTISVTYGLNNIEFIGYNHKPFILSGESYKKYSSGYLNGFPHIDDEDYISIYKKFNMDHQEYSDEYSLVDVKMSDGSIRKYRMNVAKIFQNRKLCKII